MCSLSLFLSLRVFFFFLFLSSLSLSSLSRSRLRSLSLSCVCVCVCVCVCSLFVVVVFLWFSVYVLVCGCQDISAGPFEWGPTMDGEGMKTETSRPSVNRFASLKTKQVARDLPARVLFCQTTTTIFTLNLTKCLPSARLHHAAPPTPLPFPLTIKTSSRAHP